VKIHATTDSQKSGVALHVCHCGQSVTVDYASCVLIQGIEKVVELKLWRLKQFSLRINYSVIPAKARIPRRLTGSGFHRNDGNYKRKMRGTMAKADWI
jgi:hypothetical protein